MEPVARLVDTWTNARLSRTPADAHDDSLLPVMKADAQPLSSKPASPVTIAALLTENDSVDELFLPPLYQSKTAKLPASASHPFPARKPSVESMLSDTRPSISEAQSGVLISTILPRAPSLTSVVSSSPTNASLASIIGSAPSLELAMQQLSDDEDDDEQEFLSAQR